MDVAGQRSARRSERVRKPPRRAPIPQLGTLRFRLTSRRRRNYGRLTTSLDTRGIRTDSVYATYTPYGIYPLQPGALTGILTGPLIHGSWSHLFANTLPVVILGTALFYGYPRSAIPVLTTVWLGSGLGVWLFARESYHIGASGLTFGIMFFLFVINILRWDKRAIALTMIIFFLYGSMIWGVFPSEPAISYESHLFGAVIGVLLAFVLKKHDPMPGEKKYSWEDENNEDAEESTDQGI